MRISSVKNSAKNCYIKNCFFGTTSIAKDRDKSKYAYSGYGIAFTGLRSWNFGNDFAEKVLIFGVDNSPSSHIDNRKNNFLVLDEGPTNDINSSIGEAEKRFSINFS